MTASIDYLPVWKRGATPYERMLEIAEVARKHPERFAHWALVFQEDRDVDGKEVFVTRYYAADHMRYSHIFAALEAARYVALHECLDI